MEDVEQNACPLSPPVGTEAESPLKVSLSFKDGVKTLERFLTARSRFETPDAERAELYKVFQRLDTDRDGKLTVAEIMQSFEKLGIALPVSELASLLSFWAEGQRSTENGHSGASPAHVEHLDFQGFYDFYRFLCQEDTRDGRVDETDLRAAFDLYDKNNDGFISVTELQSVLVSLGFEEATNLGKCKSMIESIDSNGDGVVSFDEFKAMMRTMEDV